MTLKPASPDASSRGADPAGGPDARPADTQEPADQEPLCWWHLVLAFLVPIVVAMLFLSGYDAIDNSDPDTGSARALYGLTALAGVGTVIGLHYSVGRDAIQVTAWAGGIGFVLAAGLAMAAQEGYAEWLAIGILFGLAFWLLAVLVVVLVTGFWQGWPMADRVSAVLAGAAGVGGAGAALYHMATLSRQADLARRAHQESPGLEVIFVVAALAWAAAAWRRRRVG